ncbi:putative membrane protein [Corynebacterium kroppenstedtii DSM 44385]|uniref:TVP38/TMEM64 family membrane protein n=1 Tax=Corynebacterium kroppenstedtii (strain DSM 44385 / JCM 11950 / CIP 105744 / CCUG 35717) TaxID=645127 RepID=C4LIM9_CORK4|nr:putative membrane protein [Corynebacterium kroppenstedtii DSM 44385]
MVTQPHPQADPPSRRSWIHRAVTATSRALAQFLNIIGVIIRDVCHGWLRWTRLNQVLSVVILVVLVAALFVVPLPSVTTFRNWSVGAGWWFPFAFSAVYILATQFPIPRTVFTLSCGVLFGPLIGIGVALISTGCSALLSLLIVRRLGRDWVQSRLTHPAVDGVNAHLRRRGWLAVGSLRMMAAVPFSVLNYVCALSSIKALPFTLATIVGSAPGTIATVLVGDAAAGQGSPLTILISVVLFGVGLTGLITDIARPPRAKTDDTTTGTHTKRTS